MRCNYPACCSISFSNVVNNCCFALLVLLSVTSSPVPTPLITSCIVCIKIKQLVHYESTLSQSSNSNKIYGAVKTSKANFIPTLVSRSQNWSYQTPLFKLVQVDFKCFQHLNFYLVALGLKQIVIHLQVLVISQR